MGQAVETGKEGRAAGPCSLLLSTGDTRVREHAVGSNQPTSKEGNPFFRGRVLHDNLQDKAVLSFHQVLQK